MKLRLMTVCLLWMQVSHAKSLQEVYSDALMFDPQIREAEATYKAAREAGPQAWAALLPQITGTYTLSRQKEVEQSIYPLVTADGSLVEYPYDTTSYISSHGYQLQLQQTVFSWASLSTLSEAQKKVAQAEADYHAAQQNLIVRTTTAYFNLLNAVDSLQAQTAALTAVSRQLDQASRRYDRGLIGITDVNEAQAARDSAAAAVIEGKRNVASMALALRQITGKDYDSLAKPGEDAPLDAPEPADPQRWVAVSMDQNVTLLSSRLAADAARYAVRFAIGGHLPSVQLTASMDDQTHRYDETISFGGPPGRVGFPLDSADRQVGIQISVPIFSGGATQSQVRQAQYQWIAAKDHVQTISRQTEHDALDAFNGVMSEMERVKTLRQAVVSAESAVHAAEEAYNVGLRTAAEVLQQRESLVQAQTAYAQSRYNYILETIQLQLASGALSVATLHDIGGWLTAEQPTWATAMYAGSVAPR
jgi:outer membrane protein